MARYGAEGVEIAAIAFLRKASCQSGGKDPGAYGYLIVIHKSVVANGRVHSRKKIVHRRNYICDNSIAETMTQLADLSFTKQLPVRHANDDLGLYLVNSKLPVAEEASPPSPPPWSAR